MTRYEIVNDFREKFVEQNPKVWKDSIYLTYFAINGNEIKKSRVHYSLENSKQGLVIYHYTYTAIERNYSCIVGLFFNFDEIPDNSIEIDGWKLYFSRPITALNICHNINCYMTNGKLKLEIESDHLEIIEKFEKIWQLFSLIRSCKTQREIDFAYEIFLRDGEILSLKEKSLKDEAKIDSLNMLIESHKELIHKISDLVNSNSQ